jgi:hypothetical protein
VWRSAAPLTVPREQPSSASGIDDARSERIVGHDPDILQPACVPAASLPVQVDDEFPELDSFTRLAAAAPVSKTAPAVADAATGGLFPT